MVTFLGSVYKNSMLQCLVVLIVLDTIFGIFRAIKSKEINSSIGIDGLIRKISMLIGVIGMKVIDIIIDINFIGFVPTDILNEIGLETVGLCELFGIIFIFFEFISVLKNMAKCKLPIPKALQSRLEKFMKEFTSELNEKESDVK